MKRLLRGVIDFSGTVSDDNLNLNFRRLVSSRIEWNRPDDEKIYNFVKHHFEQYLDIPAVISVRDYFVRANDVEATERIADIEAAPAYVRSNYANLLNDLLETQNRTKMLGLIKETQEVVQKGLIVGTGKEKKTLKGVRDGLIHFQQHAHDLIPAENNVHTRGNLRDDVDAVWKSYQAAKVNKDKVYGKFTGINHIDTVCHGIKRGELWVHAAFAGELKTSLALNWCYSLITRYRTNVFYVSLEMPYDQLRLIIHVMHSSHAKFRAKGRQPLDYRKVRDGELTPEEETFFQEVLEDFAKYEEHCRFEVWCPDRDVTIDDVRMEAELQHKLFEIGMVVIDHGGLMESRSKDKDYTIRLNAVLRDTKKFALHFNNGEGMATLMLFQINREGKKEAAKNEGKYQLNALSYSNECLAEGTPVRCRSGYKTIESVQIGDEVWSSSGWKSVLNTFDQGIRPVFKVVTGTGLEIVGTANHRLRVLEAGKLSWRRIDELTTEMCLLGEDIRPHMVASVKPQGNSHVYDIEVGGDHEYASAGLLSHNCERSADYVTTTYLDDELRAQGRTICCNLKNRDNPLFEPVKLKVDFSCRRISDWDPSDISASDMGVDGMDDIGKQLLDM